MISYNKYAALFYIILLKELIFFPFFWVFEFIKNHILSNKDDLKIKKLRKKIDTDQIYINIHEWGGYPLTRKKSIKKNKIRPFECGLLYQLERFNNSSLKEKINIRVTLSNPELHKNKIYIEQLCDEMAYVSNDGMDFSGYESFYNFLKNKPNAYIILTNSSVNSIQDDFLEGYINYLEKNPDFGILGIYYCTKIYQSLIKNNFNPHLQSFFLLTTSGVLSEIVELNKKSFPGKGITHKLLLIREGEVRLSKLALQLGYNLSVVLESGQTYKFGKNYFYDNGYKRWKYPKGDMRIYASNPNKINTILTS